MYKSRNSMTKPELLRKSRLQMQKLLTRSLQQSQDWISSSKYYDSTLLFKVIVLAALEQSSVEETVELLQEDHVAIPSAETVLDTLIQRYQQLDQQEVEMLLSSHLQNLALQFPAFQGNEAKCVVAIDLHDEEYYGKDIYENNQRLVVYTKKYGRSRKALRYGTLSIVFTKNLDYFFSKNFYFDLITRTNVNYFTDGLF